MIKYALLGFLNYGPLTGYELKQYLDVSTTHFWHAKLSQIYTTLKRLEEQGSLTSEVEPQADRPDRRVYTITDAGREDLHAWLAQPMTDLEPRKETLLLKLFFSAQLDKEDLLTQLRLQRSLHEQQAAAYRDDTAPYIRQTVAQMPHLERDAILWEATRRFGQLYEELYVRWLNETIAMLEEKL